MTEVFKTGYFVRWKVKSHDGGRYENLDIADMPPAAFEEYINTLSPDRQRAWALALHKWIVDNVRYDNA